MLALSAAEVALVSPTRRASERRSARALGLRNLPWIIKRDIRAASPCQLARQRPSVGPRRAMLRSERHQLTPFVAGQCMCQPWLATTAWPVDVIGGKQS